MKSTDPAQTGILALVAAFRGAISIGFPLVDKVIWEVIRLMFFATAVVFLIDWGGWVVDHYWLVFQDLYTYLSNFIHDAFAPANAAAVEQGDLLPGAYTISPTDVPIVIPDGS